ncbi:M12 family metallopeptidase [Pseudomonas purpurea]|uniref:M12 family metallopeptidase n=1 Tax=Pseudomonas purpurea TaxID=3136737 RepID=UPI003264FF53
MNALTACKLMNTLDPILSMEAALSENANNTDTPSPGGRRKRAIATHTKFWSNHRTLSIAFLGNPSEELRTGTVNAIRQWQRSISLTLEFVEGEKGDIRIAFSDPHNYSYVGTDALLVPADQQTMNISAEVNDPGFDTVVIHEFGHALGMEHEHQHPDANIPWDTPKVYEYYKNNFQWSEEETDFNIFKTYPTTEIHKSAYDTTSIMHYPIPTELTLGEWAVGTNTTISKLDRRLMRKIYPK